MIDEHNRETEKERKSKEEGNVKLSVRGTHEAKRGRQLEPATRSLIACEFMRVV